MLDKDDIINIFEGGELDPSLWPNSFKFMNFEYPMLKDRLNMRRLILSDMQIAYGFQLMGHEPPIEFFVGVQKCLDALTAIVMAEYKENKDR
ncbi:hypothetical protein HN803_04510 [candidate division WWE3 bacterium]|jgi:hypothetical protein|nr:hypothetical protein [Candidatus Scalindua sp.]MBT7350026.1 hypothetical protein [candidate division WWE3 bacterium]